MALLHDLRLNDEDHDEVFPVTKSNVEIATSLRGSKMTCSKRLWKSRFEKFRIVFPINWGPELQAGKLPSQSFDPSLKLKIRHVLQPFDMSAQIENQKMVL